jgi:hypothetical protein
MILARNDLKPCVHRKSRGFLVLRQTDVMQSSSPTRDIWCASREAESESVTQTDIHKAITASRVIYV